VIDSLATDTIFWRIFLKNEFMLDLANGRESYWYMQIAESKGNYVYMFS